MKIVGLMLARNEDWVIELSLRAALLWCDELVVLDHASTDETPLIVQRVTEDHPGRVTTLHRGETVGWNEMDHRQATLDAGRARGGTHFAIVDADEVLSGNLLPAIRNMVFDLNAGETLDLPMIPCWRSHDRYRVDAGSVWTRSQIAVAFQDAHGLAWRPHDGYHHHCRYPYGTSRSTTPLPIGHLRNGGVMHLQFAVWERLKAKHAWYKMMETVRYPGRKTAAELDAMYSQALDERGLELASCPDTWWSSYPGTWFCSLRTGHVPESWHKAECQRMLKEYGREAFVGLDLFGIV